MADDYFLLSEGTNIMGTWYDLQPKWQENRFGPTIRNIKRRIPFKGFAMEIELNPQVLANARADADLEAAMPDALTMDGQRVVVAQGDMRRVGASIAMSKLAMEHYRGLPDCTWNLAMEFRRQSDKSIYERMDQMMNQAATGAKGVISAVYGPEDATTYASGNYAFLALKTSAAMFHQGDVVTVKHSSTTWECTVQEVRHSSYFMGLETGPGILVTGTLTSFTDVVEDDAVYQTGESTAGTNVDGYPCSMPALFDGTTTPPDFFSLTRYGAGYYTNHYLVPWMYVEAADTPFDLDTHFGRMFNTMGSFLGDARNAISPAPGEERVKMSDAVICEASPELVREINRQAAAGRTRFTRRLASELGPAGQDIVNVAGSTATVIVDPGLPPIVVQQNNLMARTSVRIWDPQQWALIQMGKGVPEWLEVGPGQIWHTTTYTDGDAGNTKLVPTYVAGGMVVNTPICLLPRSGSETQNVNSSI